MKRHLKTIQKHSHRAIKSKYGKIVIIAFFIPEVCVVLGIGWAILQQIAR